MNARLGAPGWVDLSTSDVPAARTFYEGLFGWTSQDMSVPGGPDYTMFFLDGKEVAGMGPQDPAAAAAGAPSAWLTVLLVGDVDAATADVDRLGGTVVMPAMDVMTQGRMSVIQDPSGAIVALWQAIEHHGAQVFNEPGSLMWNELDTRDRDRALSFYSELLGWRWETDDNGYCTAFLGDDSQPVAGAMDMPAMVPAEAPSYWMVYFAVADCDEAVARTQELGGQVFLPPMPMGPGRFAGIVDPAGAMLMIGHRDS